MVLHELRSVEVALAGQLGVALQAEVDALVGTDHVVVRELELHDVLQQAHGKHQVAVAPGRAGQWLREQQRRTWTGRSVARVDRGTAQVERGLLGESRSA